VSVSQIADVKNSKDTATARAISKYLNRILKQVGTNQDAAKKFNQKKYTSAKGGVKSVSY
jgi:ribosomal protein L18